MHSPKTPPLSLVCYGFLRNSLLGNPHEFQSQSEQKLQAAAIADPVASATSLAVSALIHPQQEQLFAILRAKFKVAPFQGVQDAEVVELARERLQAYVDQAELIFNDLRLGSK